MTRAVALWIAAPAALALAACTDTESEEPEVTSVDLAQSGEGEETPAPALAPSGDATPMEERIATLGLLNKRNNLSQDIELRPGESFETGPVIIRLEACERTAPYEFPQETGAFVQLDVLNRGDDEHTRVFSGWLFKQNPSLNVVEHPIYDVWVKECAMRFPGDE